MRSERRGHLRSSIWLTLPAHLFRYFDQLFEVANKIGVAAHDYVKRLKEDVDKTIFKLPDDEKQQDSTDDEARFPKRHERDQAQKREREGIHWKVGPLSKVLESLIASPGNFDEVHIYI